MWFNILQFIILKTFRCRTMRCYIRRGHASPVKANINKNWNWILYVHNILQKKELWMESHRYRNRNKLQFHPFHNLFALIYKVSSASVSLREARKSIMMAPELVWNAGNCALIVSYEGYDLWHLISFICWACKTLITSAAYLRPWVFWSVIRSERCTDGSWRKKRCASDWSTLLYRPMWQSLQHITNRQDL